MLEWAFTHPEFKTQLFRFVDVFPQLPRRRRRAPPPVRVLRRRARAAGGRARARRRRAGPARQRGLGGGGAPQHPAHGAPVHRRRGSARARWPRLRRLWDQGEAITVDLLGEQVVSEPEAERYADRVVELVDVLTVGTRGVAGARHLERDPWGALPRVDVSVKPTALSPLFAPARPGPRRWTPRWRGSRPVLDRARGGRRDGAPRHRARRSEGPRIRAAAAHGCASIPDVQLGCVVQAYRKDSFADLRDLVAWSATALARAAADPAGEGRLLGPRGDRRRAPPDGRRRCSRGRPRPTRTSSGARGT